MILLVDNYDSFTYNLVQALRALGEAVEVRRNDAIDEQGVDRLAPAAVVLPPGPGRPQESGITPRLVPHLFGRVPLLGVCLGHQCRPVRLWKKEGAGKPRYAAMCAGGRSKCPSLYGRW